MSTDDITAPLLTLVPETPEVEKERMSSFRVYSVPGDNTSTRYDFPIAQLDGTEGVRPILHWMQQTEKLRLASNHVLPGDPMTAWNNILLTLLHNPAKSSYEQKLVTAKLNAHEAARQLDYANQITLNAQDANNPTAAEMAAAQAHSAGIPEPDLAHFTILAAMQEMVTDLVPTGALRRIKRYMRRGCRKPHDMKIRIFINHMNRMNFEELPLLPPFEAGNSLHMDELTEIIQYAIPSSWNKKLREQGKDPLTMGMPAFLKALEDLEASETDFQKASTDSSPGKTSSKKSSKKGRKSGKTASFSEATSDKENPYYCLKHGKNSTHSSDECKVLKKLAGSSDDSKPTKSKNKTWTKKAKSETADSKKELAAFIAKQFRAEMNAFIKDKKPDRNKKRKADLNAIDSKSDDEDDDTDFLADFDYKKLEGISFESDDESFKSTVEDE